MEPGIIRKLDEAVVNRIAAGEIIQRPANALKELIENSLDAKSTTIQIVVKSGGLKLLQIQDNGTGIRRDDLGIVCERFTTSKLSKFEDLTEIGTFGFRGEALASISHVAHLTIQTKTSEEKCAFKACYEDGKLKGPEKPCAGNQGTIITIEDLFYNMPQRKNALKSANEEFQKISDVVSKYAIHNAAVGFTLKKFGENPSLRTTAAGTQMDNVRQVYGAQIAKELMEIELRDEVHKFTMTGLMTKVNFSAKKGINLLFINHRLVESSGLKSAIDTSYNTYLAKGMHPFVYMSLEIEPANIDVNIHPTKHEVHFLYEEEIVEKIKTCLEAKLLGSNSTRTFYRQLKLPGISEDTKSTEEVNNKTFITTSGEKVQAKDLIRTDSKEQKLEKYLIQTEDVQVNTTSHTPLAEDISARKTKETKLTSVLSMRKRIENACNTVLRKTLREMVFVGVVDTTFALFQHETKLYLCNTRKYSEELFYQLLISNFQNFNQIRIEPGLSLKQLVVIALNSKDSGWTEEDGDKAELANRAVDILIDKSAIMREYFALDISPEGQLQSLPALLEKHQPSIVYLPLYILHLATEVEWDNEEECFETFCRETAKFYASVSEMESRTNVKAHKWTVEHVIYPAFKQFLFPSSTLKNQIFELTNLPTLYKVFERC